MNEETSPTTNQLTGRLSIDQTNFGPTLREAREGRGLTIENIADKLKLRPSLLALLEANEFNQLPEAIFTRSYIQSYAKIVGLDAAPFVQVYDRASGSMPGPVPTLQKATRINTPSPLTPIPTSGLAASGVNKSVNSSNSTSALGSNRPITLTSHKPSSNTIPLLPIVLAALAVLGALVWVIWSTLNKPKTQISNSSGVITSTQNQGVINPQNVLLSVQSIPKGAIVKIDRYNKGITPIKDVPVGASEARELRVEKDGYQAFVKTMSFLSKHNLVVSLKKTVLKPSNAVAKPGVINLTFKGTSWVRIKDKTGKVLFQGIPKAGSSQAFPGPITVRAGQPDQISATINGVTKEAIGVATPSTISLP